MARPSNPPDSLDNQLMSYLIFAIDFVVCLLPFMEMEGLMSVPKRISQGVLVSIGALAVALGLSKRKTGDGAQSGISRDAIVEKMFRSFDKDNSGAISSTEMRLAMHNLSDDITFDQVDQIIKDADLDGDGQIDFQEFVKMTQCVERRDAVLETGSAQTHRFSAGSPSALRSQRDVRPDTAADTAAKILARQTPEQAKYDEVHEAAAAGRNHHEAEAIRRLEFNARMKHEADALIAPYHVHGYRSKTSGLRPVTAQGGDTNASLQPARNAAFEAAHARLQADHALLTDWAGDLGAGVGGADSDPSGSGNKRTEYIQREYIQAENSHLPTTRPRPHDDVNTAADTLTESQRGQPQDVSKVQEESMREKRAAVGMTQDRGPQTATERKAVVMESHSSDPGFLGLLTSFWPDTFGAASRRTTQANGKTEIVEVAL